MESAFIRNVANGALIAPQPLQFIRVPVPGEYVQLSNLAWSVIAVVHGWRNPTAPIEPILEVRVAPPGWHAPSPILGEGV